VTVVPSKTPDNRPVVRKVCNGPLTLGIVHIVEWLRPGDAKTGWDLFGELGGCIERETWCKPSQWPAARISARHHGRL